MSAATTEAPAAQRTYDLVDPSEVARMFGVTRATVCRWIREGQLPAPARVGNAIRWRRATIEGLLDGR